ncbi:phosphinothricin acetyltransferase [Devosia pacifica]|uniref:Phosphinothricin acetyltransferase n=1 Tax=Devosia pacifica TaxID=1335967 RepID=A0A918S5E0_9HYPH|nr:GNAT family N-acetyltransferase [Devosia pacifica]GHA24119.1 phosphinothricin acetyltransferase [Devosia pacifica]
MASRVVLNAFSWEHVPAITTLYRHYVETSVATFDLEPPGERAMADKFGAMVEAGHPVIVLEVDGALRGYAYASTYRPRPAYRFTCEDSIYIHPEAVGQGHGTLLLDALIEQSRTAGFKQMIAVITAGSSGSIALHERFGFHHIGRHEKLGYKFDSWHDIVHMQRAL